MRKLEGDVLGCELVLEEDDEEAAASGREELWRGSRLHVLRRGAWVLFLLWARGETEEAGDTRWLWSSVELAPVRQPEALVALGPRGGWLQRGTKAWA